MSLVETTKTTKFVWKQDGLVLVSVGDTDGQLNLTSEPNGGGGHIRFNRNQLEALKALAETALKDLNAK